jgi:hypothetical protein
MRRSADSRFALGALLLAVAFALIAFGILVRRGDTYLSRASVTQPISTVSQLGNAFEFAVMIALFAGAIGVAIWCAYLHFAAARREPTKHIAEADDPDKT